MPTKENLFERIAPARQAATETQAPSDVGKVARAVVDMLLGEVKVEGIKDFAELRQRFSDANLEAEFRSWMTRKPNLDVTPAQLGAVFKDTKAIEVMAQRTGLAEQDILERLAAILPRMVRDVTPFGEDDLRTVRLHLLSLRKRLRV